MKCTSTTASHQAKLTQGLCFKIVNTIRLPPGLSRFQATPSSIPLPPPFAEDGLFQQFICSRSFLWILKEVSNKSFSRERSSPTVTTEPWSKVARTFYPHSPQKGKELIRYSERIGISARDVQYRLPHSEGINTRFASKKSIFYRNPELCSESQNLKWLYWDDALISTTLHEKIIASASLYSNCNQSKPSIPPEPAGLKGSLR